MTWTRANSRSKEEWFQLIQECRSSGLTDRTWCEQHGIMVSSFYNAVKRLRKNAYDIPYVSNHKTYALDITCANKQEAVRIHFRRQSRLRNKAVPHRTLTIHIQLNLWWMTFPLRSAIRQIRSFYSRSSGCCVRCNVCGYFRCRCHLYRDRLYWYEKIYWWTMCPH